MKCAPQAKQIGVPMVFKMVPMVFKKVPMVFRRFCLVPMVFGSYGFLELRITLVFLVLYRAPDE